MILVALLVTTTSFSYSPRFRTFSATSAISAFALVRPHPSQSEDILIKPPAVATTLVNRPKQGVITYEVREGDTLILLAEKYGISLNTILWANNTQNPESSLVVGQQLTIPPVSGILYTVQPGDKIEELAWRFQSDVSAIVEFNQLTTPGQLVPGDRLIIPGGRPTSSAVSNSAAAESSNGVSETTIAAVAQTQPIQYEVVSGDTLVAIATRFGTTAEAIAAANNISRPGFLSLGDKLLIPLDGISAQAPATPPNPKPRGPVSYAVAPGDTLAGIAQRYGISVDTLRWSNNISNANLIAVGTELTIPPGDGILYKVQSGDTLADISQRYGVKTTDIVGANGLTNPNLLVAGAQLFLPGARIIAPPAPKPAPQPARGEIISAAQPATEAPAQTPAAVAPSLPASQPNQEPAPSNNIGVSIVELASKYLGYPYVWGGTTPQGFDCSGFVYFILRQSGIPITRDLWGQLQSGDRVAPEELRPGDIVFFQNTYQRGLSHDGIYIGGGRFISAVDERKGVTVSNMWDSYWGPRFYGARRPY